MEILKRAKRCASDLEAYDLFCDFCETRMDLFRDTTGILGAVLSCESPLRELFALDQFWLTVESDNLESFFTLFPPDIDKLVIAGGSVLGLELEPFVGMRDLEQGEPFDSPATADWPEDVPSRIGQYIRNAGKQNEP